jgi:hypothetical protein
VARPAPSTPSTLHVLSVVPVNKKIFDSSIRLVTTSCMIKVDAIALSFGMEYACELSGDRPLPSP